MRKKVAPVRVNMRNQSRRENFEKFTILCNLGDTKLKTNGDQIVELDNISTSFLSQKQPEILNFRYIRVRKATVRWELKDVDRTVHRFRRAFTGSFYSQMLDQQDANPNDFKQEVDLSADDQRDHLNEGSVAALGSARFWNLENFTAHALYPKRHALYRGMRTFKPYIQTNRQFLWTDPSNAPQGDDNEQTFNILYKKDFSSWHAINTGDLRPAQWVNDVRIVIPQFQKKVIINNVYHPTTNAKQWVEKLHEEVPDPFYKVTVTFEVECKCFRHPYDIQYEDVPAAATATAAPQLLRTTRKRPILPESEDVKESNAKLQKLIDEAGSVMDQGTQPIKDAIKDSVVNSIANSNPLLATVASVIGVHNSRFRDEIK